MDENNERITKEPFDYDQKCPWQNFAPCLKFQCPFYQWFQNSYVLKAGDEDKPENYIPVYGCHRAIFERKDTENNGQ